jgi:hypothetical protein
MCSLLKAIVFIIETPKRTIAAKSQQGLNNLMVLTEKIR